MTKIWEGDIVRADGREGIVVEIKEHSWYDSLGRAVSPSYLVRFPQDDQWWYSRAEIEPVLAEEYV